MKLAKLMLAVGLTAILGLVSALPGHAIDAAELIRKSETAEHNVSYRGFKYADIAVGGRTVRAHFKIVHKKPDRTRTDYFAPQELAGIITIEKGPSSWKYLPSTKRWQHNKWELSSQHINLVMKNYSMSINGKASVGGRQAHIVKLTPKKRGNPSQTLWIDTEYYVTLKSELRNSSGVPISVSAFQSIDYEPRDIFDSAFEVDATLKESDPTPKLGFKVVKPKYIPKGYTLAQVSTIPIGKTYAAHLMYTNGINTISVFQRLRGGKDTDLDKPGFGKWANVAQFDSGKITFTIISDINKKEVQKIAASMK